MSATHRFLFSGLALTFALTLLGPVHAHADGQTLRIGALLCLSGGCAEVGDNALKGVQLAVDELNAAGGVLGQTVVLSVQDTKEAEAGANVVSAYQKLALEPDVHYIIGPSWTIGGLPLIPIIGKRDDVIITSPSLGVAEFNEAADHIFNTWPHDSYTTTALAKFAIDTGWKKVAVLSNQGPWESAQAKVFADAYKKLGGEITAYVEPLGESRDLKGEILKIRSSNPDAVFMSNYTQMDIAAKELDRLHYQGHKLAILMDETRIKNSDGALNGTIYGRYPDPSTGFQEAFRKKYGSAPGISADTGYDTMKLYAAAIQQAQTVDTKIVKGVLLKSRYSGASGQIEFDSKGGVIKSPQLWVVKDGKQQVLAAEK